MNIRHAIEKDLQGIVDIYNDAIEYTTATFDLEKVSIEDRKGWFDEHVHRYPLIVAVKWEKIVGYATLSPYNKKEAYSKTVELSVYVDREERGQGIGRALMDEILHLAKENEHRAVISLITKGNEHSISMHKRYGFFLCGELKEVGYKFNQWQDVLLYQLLIN
jgi:L-amino acid N-acyltransferase